MLNASYDTASINHFSTIYNNRSPSHRVLDNILQPMINQSIKNI